MSCGKMIYRTLALFTGLHSVASCGQSPGNKTSGTIPWFFLAGWM